MSKKINFEFNDYIIAIDEPYENDCGYVSIGKKQSNGINIVFKSPNKGTVNWFIELQKYITDLQSQLDQANEKLNEHNEYFKEFNCKDFKGFRDFISLFMLTPHEKLTLIKELQNQLSQANERLKGAIVPKFKIGQEVYKVYTKDQRFPFKVKIIGFKITLTEEKISVLYDTAEDGFDMDWCPEKILFETLEEAEKKLQELRGGE